MAVKFKRIDFWLLDDSALMSSHWDGDLISLISESTGDEFEIDLVRIPCPTREPQALVEAKWVPTTRTVAVYCRVNCICILMIGIYFFPRNMVCMNALCVDMKKKRNWTVSVFKNTKEIFHLRDLLRNAYRYQVYGCPDLHM